MIRLCALALAIGAAAALSWLLPRFDAPLDRFSVALELLETGEAEKAAFLFEDPSWQGIAQYRAERFPQRHHCVFHRHRHGKPLQPRDRPCPAASLGSGQEGLSAGAEARPGPRGRPSQP